jgi:thiamine monophosphate synthase
VAEAIGAGAHGVAALGGVWNADDPAAAVRTYVEALRRAEVTA